VTFVPLSTVPDKSIRHRQRTRAAGVLRMKKQVIEYAGIPVGIVIPDEDRLKFIAVKFHVHDLDEQRFSSPDEVKLAIHDLMTRRHPKPIHA
jgi:hypothetical protein